MRVGVKVILRCRAGGAQIDEGGTVSAEVGGCSIVANDDGDIAAGKRSAVSARLAARAVGAGVGSSHGPAAGGGGAMWNWSTAPIAAYSETESSKTDAEEVQSGLVGLVEVKVRVGVGVGVRVSRVRIWVWVSVRMRVSVRVGVRVGVTRLGLGLRLRLHRFTVSQRFGSCGPVTCAALTRCCPAALRRPWRRGRRRGDGPSCLTWRRRRRRRRRRTWAELRAHDPGRRRVSSEE